MNNFLSNAPAPPWFYLSTRIVKLEDGLLELLDEHLKQHPETKLVIIDTFQKIRGLPLRGERWYDCDYREAGMVKEFADKKGICVLFVTHTTKTKDKENPFNDLMGTTGVSGVMDTSYVLRRPHNVSQGTLHMTGRDIGDDVLAISLNKETCHWELVGDAEELAEQEALFEYQANPLVKTIRALLAESPGKRWKGSAKNLLEAGERFFGIPIAPSSQAVGKELTKLKGLLSEQDKIVYIISPNGTAGYVHHFYYAATVDSEQDDAGEDIVEF